jgi:hypothetical protein
MGTTTNNGWPTPVATDLVKDGWEAIKDLGDAIDTTLGVYAPSTSGLTLINTTSFSAVASQSFNNVFSSTYNNYRLVAHINNSISTTLTLRMRIGGVDFSGANYDRYGIQTGASNNNTRINQINETSAFITNPAQPSNCFSTADIIAPNLAQRTFLTMNNYDEDIRDMRVWTISHSPVTQYDGFTVLTSSGTMTGRISIYGYAI